MGISVVIYSHRLLYRNLPVPFSSSCSSSSLKNFFQRDGVLLEEEDDGDNNNDRAGLHAMSMSHIYGRILPSKASMHRRRYIFCLSDLKMSFMAGREFGSKTGSGFVSKEHEATDRRERLRRLALETIDLSRDPYFMKNHLGQYECRLCLTLHKNEGNYLAHTQGKRHQQNMAKRAAMEAAEKEAAPAPQRRVAIRKTVKIGRPGYRVTKEYDQSDTTKALLFQIEYPEISDGERPRHRFMSAIEQKKEPTDWRYQYLLFAAEPYETICFKIPNMEVDNSKKDVQMFRHWDQDGKVYSLQIPFRNNSNDHAIPAPPHAM